MSLLPNLYFSISVLLSTTKVASEEATENSKDEAKLF